MPGLTPAFEIEYYETSCEQKTILQRNSYDDDINYTCLLTFSKKLKF
uniref:Uncharacterized protein n=1 Tax=Romanomermis culicivorax TaxID=13658 RepID=A0A915KK20_ROMCU